jgi:hypothetical protein
VAVRVTTLPEFTEVTAAPPEVTARVVVVAVFACAGIGLKNPARVTARIPTSADDSS